MGLRADDLIKLDEVNEFNSNMENKRLHPNTPAVCNTCDWKGRLKDCPTEMDSEGW